MQVIVISLNLVQWMLTLSALTITTADTDGTHMHMHTYIGCFKLYLFQEQTVLAN